jgi:hypothetical protein
MTPLFKLQAQISQAKIPVGDAVFSTLVVNVLSGGQIKCAETFSQIAVRSGVLNLEIGRTIDCNFDDVIAKYNDLSFQVCIGDTGAGNCLKPIQMASVPYAIKANYASQAQNAYQAELASRANYAQRLSADSNMLDQKKLGQGYFDVQTPGVVPGTGNADALKVSIPSAEVIPGSPNDVTGGFLYWSPVDPAKKILNLGAKNPSTKNLEPLTRVLIHANQTDVRGNLYVGQQSRFDSTATFNGSASLNGSVDVNVGPFSSWIRPEFNAGLNVSGDDLEVYDGLNVFNWANFGAYTEFNGGVYINAWSPFVSHSRPTFDNGLTVSVGRLDSNNGLAVIGATTLTGGVQISGGALDALIVGEEATFNKSVTFNGGVNLGTSSNLGTVNATTLNVSGASNLNTARFLGDIAGAPNTVPANLLRITGGVAFQNGSLPGGGRVDVQVPSFFGGAPNATMTVSGKATFNGQVDMSAATSVKLNVRVVTDDFADGNSGSSTAVTANFCVLAGMQQHSPGGRCLVQKGTDGLWRIQITDAECTMNCF